MAPRMTYLGLFRQLEHGVCVWEGECGEAKRERRGVERRRWWMVMGWMGQSTVRAEPPELMPKS